MDSGAPPKNGFDEPEIQYVDPPERDLQVLLGLVEPEDAAEGEVNPGTQTGDESKGEGAGNASAASPTGAADSTEVEAKEVEVPFKRKEPPKPGPRDFALSCKVWSPFFAKWIKQDAVVYCLDVKEACQASGQWTEDMKVPELFGALELWDENSISDIRDRHNNIMERVTSHAESIKDKTVNYYRWEGQGLALIADQHGFSKQLVDFYSRAPVWDYQDEEAMEKWNAIMRDAVEVSEQALVQGVGIGPPKQKEGQINGEDAQDAAAVKADEVEPATMVSHGDHGAAASQMAQNSQAAAPHTENGPTADAKEGQEGSAGVEEAGIKTSEDASYGGGAAPDEVKIDSEGICQVLPICIIEDSD